MSKYRGSACAQSEMTSPQTGNLQQARTQTNGTVDKPPSFKESIFQPGPLMTNTKQTSQHSWHLKTPLLLYGDQVSLQHCLLQDTTMEATCNVQGSALETLCLD